MCFLKNPIISLPEGKLRVHLQALYSIVDTQHLTALLKAHGHLSGQLDGDTTTKLKL